MRWSSCLATKSYFSPFPQLHQQRLQLLQRPAQFVHGFACQYCRFGQVGGVGGVVIFQPADIKAVAAFFYPFAAEAAEAAGFALIGAWAVGGAVTFSPAPPPSGGRGA